MKSLNLSKPRLIVIVGIPGAGKSFFGQQFSETFNAPMLDVDDILELTSDEQGAQRIWDFTLNKLLQTKQTLILEGPGATKAERQMLSTYAHKRGYQSLYIWVQTEPNTAKLRATKGAGGKQNSAHTLSVDEFHVQADQFQALTSSEPYIVISGKHTYASQAKNVLKKLAEPRAEKASPVHVTTRANPIAEQTTSRTGRITIN